MSFRRKSGIAFLVAVAILASKYFFSSEGKTQTTSILKESEVHPLSRNNEIKKQREVASYQNHQDTPEEIDTTRNVQGRNLVLPGNIPLQPKQKIAIPEDRLLKLPSSLGLSDWAIIKNVSVVHRTDDSMNTKKDQIAKLGPYSLYSDKHDSKRDQIKQFPLPLYGYESKNFAILSGLYSVKMNKNSDPQQLFQNLNKSPVYETKEIGIYFFRAENLDELLKDAELANRLGVELVQIDVYRGPDEKH